MTYNELRQELIDAGHDPDNFAIEVDGNTASVYPIKPMHNGVFVETDTEEEL